jgi:hypothetical protein
VHLEVSERPEKYVSQQAKKEGFSSFLFCQLPNQFARNVAGLPGGFLIPLQGKGQNVALPGPGRKTGAGPNRAYLPFAEEQYGLVTFKPVNNRPYPHIMVSPW